ncbi:kinase-like domain-containing protein [Rhizophagus irregularis DAOM 181602=DAOM 197198]|uniref:Kinase-like domain-containing protein n=1 Tax=Rhizophagus irregularis (strain DAOM 181602 / DAOM 197198 / MUCL 43194) TaxID=747089 RepID=A0A2P4QVR4_RHIID|nr:kinase-like domain-containing protein [Rhizophagus irregularis DAOM 181602=DAOM 197198]POG81725.1 kinase-like domain-containing protein [Rhizophagus irregularis DAOM 181602=DAOM 197198]|eukprot:XP_025188591.1 kinase-like domain-containing protein [Rhizophagus irregularis DAOM 181602=DAOM 197198]
MSFIKKLSKFINKLNISDKDSNSVKINHENCYDPDNNKFWCKECVPRCIIEGWTSGNDDIDNFIKDTIYNYDEGFSFLEWVPFDRFEDMKQIGKGGFAKVYSATWIDGIAKYIKQDDGNWIKSEPESKKVALKMLNGSQNMSADFLNELKTHRKLNCLQESSLEFYGITKDPETEEFIMIMQYADDGNLRNILSSNFNKILWKEKLKYLSYSALDLKYLHELGYFHKDFHSGNILSIEGYSYISDFGLSGPSNEQKLDNKIYGVLPYIAPEVLNGEPYTLSSYIYSFGVIMAELSSGKPPFHKRNHDNSLALKICNGLRPEFGKGTPEIYKKLAHRCMDANPNQRPTANELYEILDCWYHYNDDEKYGYKGKEVKAVFDEADKEIPNISALYEKDPDAIYTSRAFTFKNLSKPINSSFIVTTYLNEEDNDGCQDSQLVDLEISSSLKLKDDDVDN